MFQNNSNILKTFDYIDALASIDIKCGRFRFGQMTSVMVYIDSCILLFKKIISIADSTHI